MSEQHRDIEDGLIGNCCGVAGENSFMEYDEDGSLALARALGGISADTTASHDVTKKPCPVSTLNGSWYLQLTPTGPHTLMEIRGPMRIEVASPKLRISGDIYVRKPTSVTGTIEIGKPITERPFLFGKNWYPQFRIDQYAWYFRSVGVTYKNGKLVFKFERSLWNKTTQDFISQENNGKDSGFMELECLEANVFTHPALPQPTMRITGTAQIGGVKYDAVATKTSGFYRGCAVEVDVMTNRSFPESVTMIDNSVVDFKSVYRTAGIDCDVSIDQKNLPEDVDLNTTELQTALATNQRPTDPNDDTWRLWLFVGSAQGNILGLMFDDVEPFRQGTAGFFDPGLGNLPILAASARNRKIGEVPAAFLRTLLHESGHAFNLFHPKHDVHVVPLGTTIMNQTGDVMMFANTVNTFPGNITFAFDEHNRTSLIHSPDPQVRPGWKRFGFGHGSLNGITEPTDAIGFLQNDPPVEGLELSLTIPEVVFRGQFVTAQFVLTNTGNEPRQVTTALNLSQGDLRLLLKPPNEELNDVRDVILACSDRPLATLAAGESLRGSGQIFYTNYGFTFRQTGRFYVSAELNVGDALGSVVRSKPSTIVVRGPATPEEEDIARLSMDPGVGRAFAFGDFGTDDDARVKLEELANKYGDTETGAAAALTLSNSHGRDLRDLYSGTILRSADSAEAEARFNDATSSSVATDNPETLVSLATAVAAPTESNAPILGFTSDYLTPAAATSDALADTAGTAKQMGEADALDRLKDIRRCFVQRKDPVKA
ncbi:MAG TPA: hypothetical protein VJR02_15355 [Pyrinomonadaceae bacterium]|nr:hypothetical protein [Pyrinomonadaceae bacterium]